MRLTEPYASLFQAYSKITATAFINDRLLSCPVLSKAPNYGNILDGYITKKMCTRPSFFKCLFLLCRYCLSNTGQFFFLLMIRFFCVFIGWHGSLLSLHGDKRTIVIDTFALLPRIAASGTFSDVYLPTLEQHVIASGALPFRYYRLYGTRNPILLIKGLRVLMAQGHGAVEVQFLSFIDWFRLIKHCAVYPFALLKLIKCLEAEHSKKNTPERYIIQALYDTMGACILAGEVARLAGRGLAKQLKGGTIISWYENQTVNKAFYRGLRQKKSRLRTLGAQLLIWPEALLNNHPDDGEAALGLTPDKILVNGSWYMPENSRQTYSVGPALRYQAVYQPCIKSEEKKYILVLLSYHVAETRRIMAAVTPLIKEGKSLAFKFHPTTSPTDFYDAYGMLPAESKIVEGLLSEALASAEVVLGSGSGALAEAVAMGVPALAITGGEGVVLNYLPVYGQGDLWLPVQKAEEVEGALAVLLKASKMPEHGERVATFRSLLFAEPTEQLIKESFEL